METTEILETGVAMLLFATTFLAGNLVHPLQGLIRDRRSIISFGAGISVAYVFVYAIPELCSVRRTFTAAVSMTLPYGGMVVHFLALVGFLVFYDLDHLSRRLKEAAKAGGAGLGFKFHIAGFAVYVWLMGYLLVNNLDKSPVSTALYAVAIAFHFLALGHALQGDYGTKYVAVGRFVLAGMSVVGWGTGLLFPLPQHVLALLTAFISGAIIMNSAVMELPTEKNGRFLPFMIGGTVYGLILMPLG
jgi:hypothetical protein